MLGFFKNKENLNELLASVCGKKINLAKTIKGSPEEGSSEFYLKKILSFVEGLFSNLRMANSKVAARGINLQDDIGMIQEQLGNYVDQTATISSATEEMSATVKEITSLTASVHEAAAQMKEVAEEGNEIVSGTTKTMREIVEEVKNSAREIEILGQSSETIGKVINVIEDIADQTNLLALNAAIEAARAGDQGRGFAVVADEVRKLAERTTTATAEISNIIKDIQGRTKKAVEMMEQNVSKVEAGSASTDKADASLKNILQEARKVETMVARIDSAIEQHEQATTESATSVDRLLSGVQMTSERIKQDTLPYIKETISASQEVDSLFSGVIINDKALIRIAIGDHLLWLERIDNMLKGKIRLASTPTLGDHTQCRLGKWYFSQDHAILFSNAKSQNIFKELDAPHKRVHQIFLKIINAFNNGDHELTKKVEADLRHTSREIVDKLKELENSLEA